MSWGFELIDVSVRAGEPPGLRPGERAPLRQVNLGARMGLVTAVVGPAGSGKTTLFRLLAGLERPDTGAVLVAGREISRARPAARRRLQRRMSVVFQGGDAGLFARATVLENVTFGMRAAGRVPMRRIDQVAREELGRFALHGLEHARPVELDLAQRRCLALARGVALRAPLVLVDGLDDGLDEAALRRVCATVREECRVRAATWLVTVRRHDVARVVADEVHVLADDGEDARADAHAAPSSAVRRR